jgi:hypothetical protein
LLVTFSPARPKCHKDFQACRKFCDKSLFSCYMGTVRRCLDGWSGWMVAAGAQSAVFVLQDGFQCTKGIRQLERDMALRRMPIVACTADYQNAQASRPLVEKCVKDSDMDDCIVSLRPNLRTCQGCRAVIANNPMWLSQVQLLVVSASVQQRPT